MEQALRKIGLKPAFSTKFKEAVPKTEVLEQLRIFIVNCSHYPLVTGGGSTKQCGALEGGFHFHRKSLLPCQQLSLLESLMPDVLPPDLPYKEGQDRKNKNLCSAACKRHVTVSFLGLRHAATYSHMLTKRACRFWAGGAASKKFIIFRKILTVWD
jgi:hypothetical protein